jgi:protein-tyrosine phosphatase
MTKLACYALAALMCGTLAGPAMSADRPTRIAFVDTGNTGRSVSSEALALDAIHTQNLNIQVISRAVDLNPYNIVPEANAAMILQRRGIDVSSHRAAPLTAADVKYSDLILTATARHKDLIIAAFPDAAAKTHTMAEYATGMSADIDDAFGKDMAFYEHVLGQIASYLPAVLAKAVTLSK